MPRQSAQRSRRDHRNTSSGTTFDTRLPDGTLISERGAGGTRYFLHDYQGSTSAILSGSGVLYGSYKYDPYGKVTVNPEGGSSSADFNPWRYLGAFYNTDGDGVYKFGARYYDGQGHFTQPDALQGGIEDPQSVNSYAYAAGDPVNNTDLSGNSIRDISVGMSKSNIWLWRYVTGLLILNIGINLGARIGAVGGIGGAIAGIIIGGIIAIYIQRQIDKHFWSPMMADAGRNGSWG